ncbi:methylated-DNA--[protein]-cysteine S-methyltransferase [Thalassobacillus pellis]|uniref:methylated-DNA--[protein]-cysteine S-methyltransferase n=1 Tax=Thalassobacillus pellis TaxID=748008 RepID=UPI001EF99E70|nr:methylated-DNA--[protein]-cysteine S-methyltransferase [Thalassobacillus pellis]MBM7554347.1 methylated-DNA-[protein]-cysteine S-methyltransferase [Thalassobacillus pellis]
MRVYMGQLDTPVGILEVRGTEKGICSAQFVNQRTTGTTNHIIKDCLEQLEDYFHKRRKIFTVPLSLQGTDFQQHIWKGIMAIPYGKTITYADLAALTGNAGAARAAGTAIGRNPLAILIPCHRAVGKSGKITGFAWGIWRKEWLLKHEKKEPA